MSLFPTEIIEEILLRSDVKDLIRYKSASNSWLSLITNPEFIKLHLERSSRRDHDDYKIGDRRIVMSVIPRREKDNIYEDGYLNYLPIGFPEGRLLGSSNGLVCVSPTRGNILVLNPETREVKKLKKAQIPSKCLDHFYRCSKYMRYSFGFGYDSVNDDYKVVIGFRGDRKRYGRTYFQLLTLKTNNWEDIGEVDYDCDHTAGIFCNGALYWVAYIREYLDEERVILSFDLSENEFVEIPQPDDWTYLGIMDGCLCAFDNKKLPNGVWVMKDYNVKPSWELVVSEHEIKTDIVHQVKDLKNYIPNKRSFCYEKKLFDQDKAFLGSPLYIPSLVSPHACREQKRKRQATGSQNSAKGGSNFYFRLLCSIALT